MTIQQDIDRLFKQGLHEYSENPPNFVWNNIEHRLNKKRLKQKRNIVYSIAASIALLLSFGSGYMFTHIQKKQIADNSEILLPQNETKENSSKQIKNINTNNNNPIENNTKNKPAVITNKIQNSLKNKITSNKPINNKQNESGKIKKVHSAGVLLSPMYAGTAVYDNIEASSNNSNNKVTLVNNKEENSESVVNDDDETELKKIDKISVFLPIIEPDKEIKYECYDLDSYTYAENSVSTKETQSWGVGLGATPLFSYRTVSSVSSESNNNADVFSGDYSNEKPFTAYSAGVNINYKVAKRWKINSGLYVSQTGLISEGIVLNEIPPTNNNIDNYYTVNTSNGNININGSPNELISKFSQDNSVDNTVNPPLLPGQPSLNDNINELDATFVQTYDYYEIPLVVSYAVIDRKLIMNLSGGLSTNIMYNNSVYFEDNSTKYELNAETENLNNISYSGILGIGVEYPIIKKLNFNLQPTLRYSLTPINNSGSVYPYSFGIYTGLKYNF